MRLGGTVIGDERNATPPPSLGGNDALWEIDPLLGCHSDTSLSAPSTHYLPAAARGNGCRLSESINRRRGVRRETHEKTLDPIIL